MPDRIIRDELLESPRWVSLKDNADRLAYVALLLKADAHGNFTADPWRLQRLWRDFGISNEAAVAKTMAELVDHDLIRLYQHDGSPFLHIPRYRQALRYTKRTLPRSPWCEEKQKQTLLNNSHGDHTVTATGSPSAHNRRKEGSEVKRSDMKEVRARGEAVDNSTASTTSSTATPQVKTIVEKLTVNGEGPKPRSRDDQLAYVKAQTRQPAEPQ